MSENNLDVLESTEEEYELTEDTEELEDVFTPIQGSEILLMSSDNYDLGGTDIVCASSFKNLDTSEFRCLIFNSSTDEEFIILRELSRLKGEIEQVIYINSKINPLLYCIFTGLNADIYDSESYLLDPQLLLYLVENYKQTDFVLTSPNDAVDTLARSIAALSTKNIDSIKGLLSNDFWLKTLSTAVSNVDTAVVRSTQVGIDVLAMVTEASKLIDVLEETNQSTAGDLSNLKVMVKGLQETTEQTLIQKNDELSQMKQVISELESKERPNSPFIFSRYDVPVNTPRVLYIKAYGHCRYLNSFFLAYQHYLKMQKQYVSKMLIITPKMKDMIKRYEGITRLAPDSVELLDMASKSVFVTFEPRKLILDAFFSQQNTQIFIVVDWMYGDPLVAGHMVEKLFAVSGVSDITRFNLRVERTLMPIVGVTGSITVPHIPKYSNLDEHTRRTAYFNHCADRFEKVDKFAIQAVR